MTHPQAVCQSLRLFTLLFLPLTVQASIQVEPFRPLTPLRALRAIQDAKGTFRSSGSSTITDVDPESLWSQKDYLDDTVPGTSTEKAYKKLALVPPAEPILVAVIDNGVDIDHEDLQGLIWTNPKEIPGDRIDNDQNGYVDDIHGWNFLGSKDGRHVDGTTFEVTREYRRLRALADAGRLPSNLKPYFERVKKEYEEARASAENDLEFYRDYFGYDKSYRAAWDTLVAAGVKDETSVAVSAFKPKNDNQETAKETILTFMEYGFNGAMLAKIIRDLSTPIENHYNLDREDPSVIIGDDPNNFTETGYGNPDVKGPDGSHGTHCAGIIGALRDNGIGIQGQSNFIRILPIRAVPDGDERDKDVANAIRYAVDQGARIVNMSFGKAYSPQKAVVDAAVKYAEEKGVLLVHGAGNGARNSDEVPSFPTPYDLSKQYRSNWIEVGASGAAANENLVAQFSNYGKKNVDLFAPGIAIVSSTPGNTYDTYEGTSMAAPEVAGVAALVLSQAPTLLARELKGVLMSTVTTFTDLQVIPPGANDVEAHALDEILKDPETKLFSDFSVSGGIVNAYQALVKVGVLAKP